MSEDLRQAVLDLAAQNKELVATLKAKSQEGKDFWDKLSASSGFISGCIVTVVGLYFTTTFNDRQSERDMASKTAQLKVAQVEVLHKFLPELNGSERDKKLALIAISALGEPKLAIELASLDKSYGSKDALKSIAASSLSLQDKQMAKVALEGYGDAYEKQMEKVAVENYKEYADHLSGGPGGSQIGLAGLARARDELKAGAWESKENDGPRIRKYLDAVGLSQGAPWSAAFVSWCFKDTSVPPPFPASPSWNQIIESFKAKGWYHEESSYIPVPGDLMFRRTVGTSYHGGIVFHVTKDQIETLEGNAGHPGGPTNMVIANTHPMRAPNVTYGHIPDQK